MKRLFTRKETAPPNLAAKALRLGQYRQKIEKSPKTYSRKVKHKGSPPESELPLPLEEAAPDLPGAPEEADSA